MARARSSRGTASPGRRDRSAWRARLPAPGPSRDGQARARPRRWPGRVLAEGLARPSRLWRVEGEVAQPDGDVGMVGTVGGLRHEQGALFESRTASPARPAAWSPEAKNAPAEVAVSGWSGPNAISLPRPRCLADQQDSPGRSSESACSVDAQVAQAAGRTAVRGGGLRKQRLGDVQGAPCAMRGRPPPRVRRSWRTWARPLAARGRPRGAIGSVGRFGDGQRAFFQGRPLRARPRPLIAPARLPRNVAMTGWSGPWPRSAMASARAARSRARWCRPGPGGRPPALVRSRLSSVAHSSR